MVNVPRRGEVWWAEMPEKRRPVLVLTRDAAIPVLNTVMVAPITSRARVIPTEVHLDGSDGMPRECVVSLDNLTNARQAYLTDRITKLSPVRMQEVCRALNVAAGC